MAIGRRELQAALSKGGDGLAVADRLRITVVQLRTLCQKFGLGAPRVCRESLGRLLPPDSLRRRLETGDTISSLARDLGLPVTTISDYAHRCGVTSNAQARYAAMAQVAVRRATPGAPMVLEPKGDPFGALLGGAQFVDVAVRHGGPVYTARQLQPAPQVFQLSSLVMK